MAKGKKKQQSNGVAVEDVVAEPPTSPHTTVVTVGTEAAPPEEPTETKDERAAEPRGVVETAVDTAVSTVSDLARLVNSVVPQRLPVYLGGAALLVLGVVDPPLVVGGALGYEAIRRWGPAPRTQ